MMGVNNRPIFRVGDFLFSPPNETCEVLPVAGSLFGGVLDGELSDAHDVTLLANMISAWCRSPGVKS